ncbi:hypothetical protein [Sediminibacillus massiliensis]|nr:hypothetical protein [Sediminibacillus massiliensis]
MITIIRFVCIAAFSLTAISLFTYQGIEIFHSVKDFLFHKSS